MISGRFAWPKAGSLKPTGMTTCVKATAANINRELEHMQDAWPGRSLRSISKKAVIALVDKAMKRGPSAGVTAWKVAKAFFAWCEARRMISLLQHDQFVSLQRKNRATGCEVLH
jgi:hypothetical protein